MWEAIIQFLQNNSTNIVVSLLVGFVFFILGPLGLWFSGKKVRRERVRKAKESLVDLLESMIVSQSVIDETKLKSLYRSVERDVDIDLSGDYQIEHWLGDVALRFEKSRHLSSDQKQTYYECIRGISEEIRISMLQKGGLEVPRKFEPVINDLKESIANNDYKAAFVAVNELEKALIIRERGNDPILNIFRLYVRVYKKIPVTFTFAVVIITIIYLYLISKFLPVSIF